VVQCGRCSLVYLNPRPGPEVIDRDYDWFRHGTLQKQARKRRHGLIRRFSRRVKMVVRGLRPRERRVLRRIRQFVRTGRFLDVGCGNGFMVGHMAVAGFEAHGFDLSEEAVAMAREQGRTTVVRGTLYDTPFPDGHFDAILLMSILEHEHRPSRALGRVKDLLRPGGHAFIKVPNYACWNRAVLKDTWSGWFFPQHLYYFTPKTLARVVEKAGLEVVRNSFWDHAPVSDVMWMVGKRPA
jgi:2-polyprenyl-3-methyl-5-hydroxy-6-metoxy-1,4-benzoquinol methylase